MEPMVQKRRPCVEYQQALFLGLVGHGKCRGQGHMGISPNLPLELNWAMWSRFQIKDFAIYTHILDLPIVMSYYILCPLPLLKKKAPGELWGGTFLRQGGFLLKGRGAPGRGAAVGSRHELPGRARSRR